MRSSARAIAMIAAALLPALAAELKTETLQAFQDYVEHVRQTLGTASDGFLWVDSSPALRARVRAGEIVVAPVGHAPLKAPNGLIHHWIGAAFIPHVTTGDVFAVVRDYGRYQQFYGPLVIQSKPLDHDADQYRFELVMMNSGLFSKSALDGEYAETYVHAGQASWYSLASSVSIRQIDHYGEPDERRLPPDEGSGYLWRIFSIQKFVQRDGGVYVELEVIALSRGVPATLHWLVDPMVRRVARSSLETSLEKTRAAVTAAGPLHLAAVRHP